MFAFHPCLNTEKIFVVRSFNYVLEKLNDFGYFSDEMFPFFDEITARQLRDCAQPVYAKKERYSLNEMFLCKRKFVINLLKKWLVEKYSRRHRELDFFSKQSFKRENRIDWERTNYAIYGFHLPTTASNFPSKEISTYLFFVIAKEHAFIRSIFEYDKLKLSKSIETHEKYHEAFRKMLQIPTIQGKVILRIFRMIP